MQRDGRSSKEQKAEEDLFAGRQWEVQYFYIQVFQQKRRQSRTKAETLCWSSRLFSEQIPPWFCDPETTLEHTETGQKQQNAALHAHAEGVGGEEQAADRCKMLSAEGRHV